MSRTPEQSAAFLLRVMESQNDRLAALLADPKPGFDFWNEDVQVCLIQLQATFERLKALGLSVVPEPVRRNPGGLTFRNAHLWFTE